jgi:hypothetical protein
MKQNHLWIAAALSALCLTACGSTGDSAGSGTLSLENSASSAADTTAAETTTAAADTTASAETTTAAADTTASAAEETDAETSAASATAETKAAEETQTQPAAPEQPAGPDSSAPLSEKARFVSNGVTFGIGDKFADISDRLVSQTRPSDRSQPCIPGAGEIIHYYYPGMVIDTNEAGVICEVYLGHDFDEGNSAQTVGGLALGMTQDDAVRIMGESNSEYDFAYSITEGSLYFTISVHDDGKIFGITASNNDLLM